MLADGAANYTPGVSERRSGASKFYHSDRMGTDSRLTDSTQATTDTKTYDAFGMLVASTGSTPTPFGYAGAFGYQEDPDSGLKLLGHRYYDPSTGRFLTRDRAKDGRNWYNYCAGRPTKAIDRDGRYWCVWYWYFGRGKERESDGGPVHLPGFPDEGEFFAKFIGKIDGVKTLGKGLVVIHYYRDRIRDAGKGDDSAITGIDYDPFHPKHVTEPDNPAYDKDGIPK
ncbi:MAG: RHS repeat-associated core domain-containing protein [Fimbriimonas ginsengisoli]|nr:RHS repeat-associated core domain-containing protein [Fimbriimonas ginsengisoli]